MDQPIDRTRASVHKRCIAEGHAHGLSRLIAGGRVCQSSARHTRAARATRAPSNGCNRPRIEPAARRSEAVIPALQACVKPSRGRIPTLYSISPARLAQGGSRRLVPNWCQTQPNRPYSRALGTSKNPLSIYVSCAGVRLRLVSVTTGHRMIKLA
jgi:hypothetical protein